MDDYSPVGQCPKDMWDRVLAVNLNGPYLVSKAAVKQFEKQDTSVARLIINIGSDTSYRGLQTGAAYTASKAGLEALTKNMASYYGANRIYTVALLLGSMAGTNIADACAQGVYLQTYLRILAAQTMYTAGANGTPLKAVAKYCLFLSDEDITPSANGSCIVFNRNWPEA
ncbi:hypothetical protein B0T17DRAFT_542934 [Bombardia bombarda]|uniref:Uncharacterized protein n=1 Tax=Bombardia bombarda TaxID=252184 RepID=A0AA39U061_9PEZI|nr:hypothetical protein B0T17DRAFT_542934 [Bombardia bombarda]